MTTISPAVYVGTYRKYSEGSLFGKWLDLDEFDDADEFYEACAELHSDEYYPEIMFQDWEGIPDQYISESGIDPEYWEYYEAVESSHLEADIFVAAMELEIPIDMVEELYQGRFDSDEDFAYQLADDMGLVPVSNNSPNSYIDWESAARDLMMDYDKSGRHYFRTSY